MSFLSNLIKDVAPFVAAAAPGTFVGTAAAVKATADVKAAQKYQARRAEEIYKAEEESYRKMVMGSGEFGTPGLTFTPQQPQQLGFFDRLGNVASNVGNTLLTGFEAAVPSLLNRAVFGSSRPQSAAQSPAVTTVTNVGAQESSGSGSIQGNIGALSGLLSAGRNLLRTPAGQIALGGGAGLALQGMGSQPSGMRVTRKMKSQARMILNMVGGNLSAAADILGVDEQTLVMILLKRFRNDGPVVTKAALRKTKQTIRRLHSMQDVLKSITPTATMRRRAPIKRASTTTLIKN
jgi:hypothetical protein